MFYIFTSHFSIFNTFDFSAVISALEGCKNRSGKPTRIKIHIDNQKKKKEKENHRTIKTQEELSQEKAQKKIETS